MIKLTVHNLTLDQAVNIAVALRIREVKEKVMPATDDTFGVTVEGINGCRKLIEVLTEDPNADYLV